MYKTYTIILSSNIASAFVVITTLWLVSHFIQTEQFGTYNLWLSIATLVSMVLLNWPNAVFLKYARDEWRDHGRIGEIISARLILLLITIIVMFAGVWFLKGYIAHFLSTSRNIYIYVVFGAIAFSLMELGIYANQAMGKFLPSGYVPLGKSVLFLLAILAISLWIKHGIGQWLIISMVLSTGLVGIIAFAVFPKNAWANFTISKDVLSKMAENSWAFSLGAINGFVAKWVDTWVIRLFLGVKLVGIYSWAYQVTAIGGVSFGPLSTILMPHIIDAWGTKKYAIISSYLSRCRSALALVSFCICLVTPFVYPVLHLFFGVEYTKSYPVLILFLTYLPIQLLGYLTTPMFYTKETLFQKPVLIGLAGAIIQIAANLIIVPFFGIIGAAIATGLSLLTYNIIALILFKIKLPQIEQPSLYSFLLLCVAAPFGAIGLLCFGPLYGAGTITLFAFIGLKILKMRHFFSSEDVAVISNLKIPDFAKKPVNSIAGWLIEQ
jgi:O-antigen/teichoic acid export membrane protein